MQDQGQIEDRGEEQEDENGSLRVADVVRFKVKKTYPEDEGFDMMESNIMPVLLTFSEGVEGIEECSMHSPGVCQYDVTTASDYTMEMINHKDSHSECDRSTRL